MTPAVTYLFVPGDRPDRFAKALASGADRVILDLEDAVRPDSKSAARAAILAARRDPRLVALSRPAGAAPPVDSITTSVIDTDATTLDANAACALGFGGKLLIHPAQVAPVARAFRPTDTDIAWAGRVLEAVASGAAGAVAIDGKMIDKPIEKAAHAILSRAARPPPSTCQPLEGDLP